VIITSVETFPLRIPFKPGSRSTVSDPGVVSAYLLKD
jgi:hypothetical protein